MIKKMERLLVVYWLPVSATLVAQGLAVRMATEARGYVAAGGELLIIPAMYVLFRIMRGLPGFVGEVKELIGYEC